MKKTIFLIVMIICFGLLVNNTYAQKMKMPPSTQQPTVKKTETTQTTTTASDTKTSQKADKKGKKPMKGYVGSLTDIMFSGSGKITKDKAQELLSACQPLVFVVGEGKKAKIYFVFNTDGSFASKKLSNFVQNKYIGITGKTKVVNGVNWIIADKIEPMD